ncbi:MAG: ABC transporter permease [Acidimicrobiales bacterium]
MRRAFEPLRAATWVPPVVAFGLLVVVWQAVALNERFALPTVGAVWSVIFDHPGTLLRNGAATLVEALPGVAVSYCAALLLAMAMNQSRLVTRAVLPLAVVLNVTPVIAIAPALGEAFGIGRTPRPVVTAVITFFPALINAMAGLRSADPGAVEVFQSLCASRWETLWRLQLPSSLPYLFAAARVVVPLSLVGAAIAEMVTTGPGIGLGYYIDQWSYDGQLGYAWAGIVTLAAFGLVLTGAVVVVEDRVLRWRGFR